LHGFCLLGATEGGLLDIRATEAVLTVLAGLLGFKLNLKNLQKYTPAISKLKQPKFKLPSAVEEEVSYIR
jgi:proteasome assembly chaperone (PAC2) family protein